MRSLSPTSTASTVDVGFISPSFHHLDHSHHPDLFLSVDIHPHGAPPLSRGMWARSTLLGEGIVEGGKLGGGSGRPKRCRELRHDFRRVSFSLFFSVLLHHLSPASTPSIFNTSTPAHCNATSPPPAWHIPQRPGQPQEPNAGSGQANAGMWCPTTT